MKYISMYSLVALVVLPLLEVQGIIENNKSLAYHFIVLAEIDQKMNKYYTQSSQSYVCIYKSNFDT